MSRKKRQVAGWRDLFCAFFNRAEGFSTLSGKNAGGVHVPLQDYRLANQGNMDVCSSGTAVGAITS